MAEAPDEPDDDPQKARAKALRRRVDEAARGRPEGPLSPREVTDRAAAEEERREREQDDSRDS